MVETPWSDALLRIICVHMLAVGRVQRSRGSGYWGWRVSLLLLMHWCRWRNEGLDLGENRRCPCVLKGCHAMGDCQTQDVNQETTTDVGRLVPELLNQS